MPSVSSQVTMGTGIPTVTQEKVMRSPNRATDRGRGSVVNSGKTGGGERERRRRKEERERRREEEREGKEEEGEGGKEGDIDF